MNFTPNASTIRTLMNKLPFEAFEFICEEFPNLLEMPEDKCEYVTFATVGDCLEYGSLDEVAEDYGHDSFDAWVEDGNQFVIELDTGVLIIE